MPIDLKEVTLESLSDLKSSYLIGTLPDERYGRIVLVIRFEGVYRIGSMGNPDAEFMVAVGAAGISAFRPHAVIVDLSHLDYQWGDMIDGVIGLGSEDDRPSAVVVGPKSREALGTLLFPQSSKIDATEDELIYDSIEDALAYVSRRLFAEGETSLHEAAKNGNEVRVKELIADGSNVNETDNRQDTPLHLANDVDIARALIDAGADVDAQGFFGGTPLHRVQDVDVVRLLLDTGADADARDRFLRSPLYFARTPEKVKLLVGAGADIHARNRTTPLHHPKRLDVARALIEAGVNVNVIDEHGGTALDHAERDAEQFQHQSDNLGLAGDAETAEMYHAIAQLIRDHGGKRVEEIRSGASDV